jgi:hypothetical protein
MFDWVVAFVLPERLGTGPAIRNFLRWVKDGVTPMSHSSSSDGCLPW